MANQITGRIIEIGQTVQIASKNGGSSFTKREFILLQMNYIAEFESAKVASLETQVAASSINACTLGKRKTAGGYIWKKKNDI